MRESNRGKWSLARLGWIVAAAVGFGISPAYAVDEVPFFCNGTSGSTCDVFQLDVTTSGSTITGAADTCVGGEFGCPSGEQNPVWPADWDALLFPSLTSASPAITPISGTPPGPWSFATPWGNFGSFSGVLTSTLVSQGTSTILKKGTKATTDISEWTVALQQSPPKDAYLAGALATYTGPAGTFYAGDELIYFGSTRFSPNGSATVGIWFFQENVEVCSSGPNAGTAMCVGGTTTIAQHKVGDLFLFITFGGNGTAIIEAATWQGADGPAGHLGAAPGTIVLCPNANDNACAVTNENNSITLGRSPTQFQAPGVGFNVSGPGWAGFPGGVVPALQFEEGGIDLNSIFGGNAPCFSSVMFGSVTSGSSPFTASMKSILLGQFNTCAISATKSCGNAQPNASTGTVTYTVSGTVENIGGGAVTGLSIADMFNGNSQALDSNSLTCTCGSGCTITGTDCTTATLEPGGTVNYSATITTSSNGGSDVITATMGGVGGGSAQATTNTAQCPAVSFSDSISISKTCNSSLVSSTCGLTVKVDISGTVTNTSGGNLTLTNVNVYDCRGGTFTNAPNPASCNAPGGAQLVAQFATLQPGLANAQPYSDPYFPTSLPGDATSNSCPNGTYSDQVLVTAECTSSFCQQATVFNTHSASCPLCPLH